MPRWASHLFIGSYLTALGFGLVCHGLKFIHDSHPAMYFLVWDMFCGWSAYETRIHIVGEGESGRHYALAPGPWGDFHPYSQMHRQDYDVNVSYAWRLAQNTLAHTEHEPMRRIYVLEEAWSKKHNLPPALWRQKYHTEKPADHHTYWHVRRTYNAAGETLRLVGNWMRCQSELIVLDDPRMRDRARKSQTFYASNPHERFKDGIQPAAFMTPAP
jgi:hypothetical protein